MSWTICSHCSAMTPPGHDPVHEVGCDGGIGLVPGPDKKWTFHCGIHRGTLVSRDSEQPKPMESLAGCRIEAERARRNYASFGYQIWYCYAIGPDGERVTLISFFWDQREQPLRSGFSA